MSRMRRAYLRSKNVTTKPLHTGLNKVGMAELYNHMTRMRFSWVDELNNFFHVDSDKDFNRIKAVMELRARQLHEKNIRLPTKQRTMWVVIQSGKHFKLVLFWGSSSYMFVKYEDLKGRVSISRPYLSRDEAMSAYDGRTVYWLDSIPIAGG